MACLGILKLATRCASSKNRSFVTAKCLKRDSFANFEEFEMASRGILAIDFGTANTYFCKCPDDQVSPKGVDFDGKNAGLDTAILYREGKESLIGHTAFEEYGEATADERRTYR